VTVGEIVKKFVIAISIIAAALTLSGPASAGAASTSVDDTPLRLKIASIDGKPKIKVARKLPAVMSCNRDCRLSVRFVLRMPGAKLSAGGARNLFDGAFWSPGMKLNRAATRYLRVNFRSSSFKVVVRARDLENGTLAVKKKIFSFYR
jgi:hypothetical protein